MQVCNLTVKSWPSNWAQIVLTVTSGRAPTDSEPLPSVVFFSPARQMTGSYLILGHDYFLGFSFQLFSYHVAICVFVWDAFGKFALFLRRRIIQRIGMQFPIYESLVFGPFADPDGRPVGGTIREAFSKYQVVWQNSGFRKVTILWCESL
jgi:hypothetical protein